MAQKGDLLSVREDIRVVDATIRDGGLCNNFEFPDEFVKALYKANVKAGVDYMEFGYKASKELFNEKDFGKWKFCNDDDIREIVGENNTDLKIAVMADVGRTDFKNDILPKNESPIDLVRIATYINTIPAAVEMIEDCAKKGYETTINIMAVSKARTEDIITALDILGKSPVNAFYIVDSYGALYPEEARKLAELYCSYGEKYGKSVGIHAHNNQQLAFANTIEAMTQGVSYLDATVDGMGRGAGNCALELLLGFLKILSTRLTQFSKCLSIHSSSEKAELSGDTMFLICLQVSITLTPVRLSHLLRMTEKITQTLLTNFLTLSTADDAYNEIKSLAVQNDSKRRKTIELRLNDEKRRKLNRKDLITFVNTEDSIKTITAEVIDIYKYKSFKELYADLPLLKCGYAKEDISNAKPEDMIEYYSEEQQKKYGVLGIEIKVIS